MKETVLWRASVLHFLDDPARMTREQAVEYFEDGALLVEDGYIKACGPAASVMASLPDNCTVHELPGRLLVPGFIDTHVHYPQLEVLASCGVQLLDWLEQHAFPAERQYSNRQYADQRAGFFLDQCLVHGTTSSPGIWHGRP